VLAATLAVEHSWATSMCARFSSLWQLLLLPLLLLLLLLRGGPLLQPHIAENGPGAECNEYGDEEKIWGNLFESWECVQFFFRLLF